MELGVIQITDLEGEKTDGILYAYLSKVFFVANLKMVQCTLLDASMG